MRLENYTRVIDYTKPKIHQNEAHTDLYYVKGGKNQVAVPRSYHNIRKSTASTVKYSLVMFKVRT